MWIDIVINVCIYLFIYGDGEMGQGVSVMYGGYGGEGD